VPDGVVVHTVVTATGAVVGGGVATVVGAGTVVAGVVARVVAGGVRGAVVVTLGADGCVAGLVAWRVGRGTLVVGVRTVEVVTPGAVSEVVEVVGDVVAEVETWAAYPTRSPEAIPEPKNTTWVTWRTRMNRRRRCCESKGEGRTTQSLVDGGTAVTPR
jgi:hypothetical protein